MWISDRRRTTPSREAVADLGQVTLSGDPAGVFLGGERRWLPVFAPGGYRWRPQVGQQVLVLKAGLEGEAPCVAGVQQPQDGLEPGEIRLSGGSGELRLNSGGVALSGPVTINGQSLEALIRALIPQALAEGS